MPRTSKQRKKKRRTRRKDRFLVIFFTFVLLRDYVSGLKCYQVDKLSLVPTELPMWAGRDVQTDLASLPGLPDRFSIMEPGICRRIEQTFQKNAWVDTVLTVKKLYPNRVHVRMSLRRPMAAVRAGGKYYLIDRDGRRLSRPLLEVPSGEFAVPLIIADSQRVPNRGKVWSSEGIRAAAVIARTLHVNRQKFATRFAEIDVRNIGGGKSRFRSEILLITSEGTVVKWGRSPLITNSPGELTPAEKVSKMSQFEERRGPMSGYQYVDIRFDNVQHGPRVRPAAGSGLAQ